MENARSITNLPHLSDEEWNVHTSLEVMEELYNYNHWIFNKIRPWLKGKVCEIGSGTGNITQFLLNYDKVVGIDPNGESLKIAKARFVDHLNVKLINCTLDDCPNEDVPNGEFDRVFSTNVLEHIEDDVSHLTVMRKLCTRKGKVIILVPAFMCAYGSMDVAFGHYRRYTRRTLGKAFESAGLKIVHSHYMNTIGFLGWIWHGRIKKSKTIAPNSAKTFNRMVTFIDAIERILRLPFGQSLVMVGTPKA